MRVLPGAALGTRGALTECQFMFEKVARRRRFATVATSRASIVHWLPPSITSK